MIQRLCYSLPLWISLGSTCFVLAENRTFLWFSDIHLDPYYGGELAISHNKFNASLNCDSIGSLFPFGDFGCDSPQSLVDSVLEHASSIQDTDFLIITGDFVRHNNDELPSPLQATESILQTVSTSIQNHLPNIPVVPSIGNNDITPDYYLDVEQPDEMLQMVTNGLQDLLSAGDATTQFRKGAYYARSISTKLTILSLNTIVYSTNHQPRTNEKDPFGQFAWLLQQLQSAQEQQSSVYIIGHIPPTVGSYRHTQLWQEQYLEQYYSIVGQYSQQVKGQLFGHIHTEEFRIHNGAFPLFLTSSFTPIYGSNPSYRLVTYDSETYDLIDYRVHYLDLASVNANDANDQKNQDDYWKVGDSFTEAYGVADMSVASLDRVVQELQQSTDSRHWQAFLSRQHAFAHGSEVCNERCRKEWACTLTSMTRAQFNDCVGMDTMFVAGIVLAVLGAVVVLGVVVRAYLRRRHYHSPAMVEIENVWDEAIAQKELPPVQ